MLSTCLCEKTKHVKHKFLYPVFGCVYHKTILTGIIIRHPQYPTFQQTNVRNTFTKKTERLTMCQKDSNKNITRFKEYIQFEKNLTIFLYRV